MKKEKNCLESSLFIKCISWGTFWLLVGAGYGIMQMPREFKEIQRKGSIEAISDLTVRLNNNIDSVHTANGKMKDLFEYLNIEYTPAEVLNKNPKAPKLRAKGKK